MANKKQESVAVKADPKTKKLNDASEKKAETVAAAAVVAPVPEIRVVKKKKAHRLSSVKKLVVVVILAVVVLLGANAQLKIVGISIPLIGEPGIGSCIPLFIAAAIALALVIYFPKPKKKVPGAAPALPTVDSISVVAPIVPVKSGNLLFDEDEDDIVDHSVDAGPLNFAFDKYSKQAIQEINGGLYSEVVKFDEKMRGLELTGASDLDIIQTSMTGSAKFDELLTTERSSQTLSAKDISQYAMSRSGAVTIKKRGDINWTFKYGSKSFLIVREGKDGYKVSVKCFPDAVVQLNKAFMALEDSNFPSGPIWFSFSELRNLPPKIIKWLIDTAHLIAKLQQLKTDLLRTFKTSEELGINEAEIASEYKAGKSIIKSGKITLVFQKGNAADLNVLLVDPIEGLDSKGYTKELYFKFNPKEKDESKKPKNPNAPIVPEVPYAFEGLSVTLLPDKAFNEEAQVSFFERIEGILSK